MLGRAKFGKERTFTFGSLVSVLPPPPFNSNQYVSSGDTECASWYVHILELRLEYCTVELTCVCLDLEYE